MNYPFPSSVSGPWIPTPIPDTNDMMETKSPQLWQGMNLQMLSDVEEFWQTVGMDHDIGGKKWKSLGKVMFKL
jgi:hypothetical protein